MEKKILDILVTLDLKNPLLVIINLTSRIKALVLI
jgi:hypothetical protein